jgi:FAE1/Type III polyketide synthase-like protein
MHFGCMGQTIDARRDIYIAIDVELLMILQVIGTFSQSTQLSPILESFGSAFCWLSPTPAVSILACSFLMHSHKQRPVSLFSFATFKAPDSWKVSHEETMEIMRRQRCFTSASLDLMSKILARGGTGPSTAAPPGFVQCLQSNLTRADCSMTAARQEGFFFS